MITFVQLKNIEIMQDFGKIIVYLGFAYVVTYVGGWIFLAMLPSLLEDWWIFAFCGLIIFVGFCVGLYRTYCQRNEQTETKKIE